MKEFVYLKSDYVFNSIKLEKNEIGILVEENKDKSVVNFVNINNVVQIPKSYLIKFNPIETGDQYAVKVCNICNKLLPVDDFAKNQNGKNNRIVRRPSCNECRKVIDGEDLSLRDKKLWTKNKPNYVIWECPICKKRTIPGLTSKVVLDHDHLTGKPRAWICDSCNTGLGRFKDDIKTIENAIKYLKDKKGD